VPEARAKDVTGVKVGIPCKLKVHEYRVAITPVGVNELVRSGHEIRFERDAGVGSSVPNDDYVAAGAAILDTADEVWGTSNLILKVEQPIPEEYPRMRRGQRLFTYLHLAAGMEGTHALSWREAMRADRTLGLGLNMHDMAGTPLDEVLG
jgi:alanine dehydrogenase